MLKNFEFLLHETLPYHNHQVKGDIFNAVFMYFYDIAWPVNCKLFIDQSRYTSTNKPPMSDTCVSVGVLFILLLSLSGMYMYAVYIFQCILIE